MIVEAKPLHKKKKRLAKQRSAQKDCGTDAPAESALIKEFIVYNRYKELKKKAMEMKENEWQEELNQLMANSQVSSTTLHSIKEGGGGGVSSSGSAGATANVPSTTATATTATVDIESIEYIDRTPSPKSTTN